jgi:tetratricopeptide (TPR) repeat protein
MGPNTSASDETRRLEEQLQRQPESLVFARLADAHRKAGRPKKALAVLADGLARHPDYPSGHIVRARALRDLGQVDEALQSFRRVLELDGGNFVAVMELAGLADERGNADEARHWYERLVQIDPTNLEARRRLTELESPSAEPAGASVEGEDAHSWWNDSAASSPDDAGEGARDGEAGSESVATDASQDERRPEDVVVEAILNGDVPQTVRVEDTWWYEEDSKRAQPEPSRDADLLTRTMADLYAEQGLHREAAEIYKELLKDSPDDPELLARLDAVREKRQESSSASTADGPEQEAESAGAEPADDEGEPVPLGRSAGPPVAEEVRRLLRIGEERAGVLPDPESRDPGAARGFAPEPGASDETGIGKAADRPAEAPAGEADGEGPSRFARDWIRRLEADA